MLHVGAKVLHHHVGSLDHFQQDPAPLRVFEIQRQAALVRVDVLKIEAVAFTGAVVVRVGRLDLDHLRTHLTQLADGGRTRSGPRQVDHFDVRQSAVWLRHGRNLRYQLMVLFSIAARQSVIEPRSTCVRPERGPCG